MNWSLGRETSGRTLSKKHQASLYGDLRSAKEQGKTCPTGSTCGLAWLLGTQALGPHAETPQLQHAGTTLDLREEHSLRASVISCLNSLSSTEESASQLPHRPCLSKLSRCPCRAAGGRRQALCEDGHGLVLRERFLVVLWLRNIS